jgi:helix-turn-helix protein
MRNDGLGAWPSQTTLAARTGMALRTVRPALQRLVKAKWLSRVTRKPRRGRSAKGKGFDYVARLPRALFAMYWSGNGASVALFRGRDPSKPKRTRRRKSNGAIGDTQIGQQLPPNSVVELNKAMPIERGLASKQEIEDMRRAFGEIP